MNSENVAALARAVLYEGYLLYPYRRTALKNRQRWNFGVLFPPAYGADFDPSEASHAQTECLFEGTTESSLEVTVRFLQQCDSENILEREICTGTLRLDDLLQRAVKFPICLEKTLNEFATLREPGKDAFHRVRDLRLKKSDAAEHVPTRLLHGPDALQKEMEATHEPHRKTRLLTPALSSVEEEREKSASSAVPGRTARAAGAGSSLPSLAPSDGERVRVRGNLTSELTHKGCVEIMASPLADGIFKLTVRIINQSPFAGGNRDKALESAFISAHAVLAAQHGRFHSMIDPPETLRSLAAQCRNIGMWPVLVGPEDSDECMLSCAIILYDYPKIAPESRGDSYDATEIDELLTLSVQTLSEPEKEAMRREGASVQTILERSERLSHEELFNLHATMRARKIESCPFRKGDRVRLRPAGRADIFDLALAGKTATIISVEQDFEGQFYLCVVVDEDPGRDLGLEGKPGHRFFFRTEEVERL